MLNKAETNSLYHAIQWMKTVLREWKKDRPEDADSDTYRRECERLACAERTLRKLYAARRAQRATAQGANDE